MAGRCIWILETHSQKVDDLVRRRFPLALECSTFKKCVKTVGGGRLIIDFSHQIRAEFRPADKGQNRMREFAPEQSFAVMSGLHPRLGQDSPLRLLDSNTIRELILNEPFMKRTRNEDDFCSFLMRFTESEEAVVDELFHDVNDFGFFDSELSLWFRVTPESIPTCMRKVDFSLDIEDERVEKDQITGEITMWLYALPEDNEDGIVYFHFDPSTGLILIGGLGTELEQERVSSFSEPGVFEYFVDRLWERIQESQKRR